MRRRWAGRRGHGHIEPMRLERRPGPLHPIAPARHTQGRTTAQQVNRPQAAWAAAAAGGSHMTNVGGQRRDALAISARRHARRVPGSATPNPTRARTLAQIEARCGGRGSLSPARVPNLGPASNCLAPQARRPTRVPSANGAVPAPPQTDLRRRLDQATTWRLRDGCLADARPAVPPPELICAAGSTDDDGGCEGAVLTALACVVWSCIGWSRAGSAPGRRALRPRAREARCRRSPRRHCRLALGCFGVDAVGRSGCELLATC